MGKGLSGLLQDIHLLFSKELNFETRELENHWMVDVSLALSLDATRVMESVPKIVHTAFYKLVMPNGNRQE